MAQKITIDIDGDITKLQAAIAQANGALGTLGTSGASGANIKSAGKALTAGVTLPLVGIATAGVKTAAEFEVTMASLGVNAGIAGKDLERLGKLADKLGADTVFSANEAAQAMLELSKAGISPAAIEGGVLANTLNLAATEGIGLVEASTIMANTMNAFGLEAKNTGKIVDILAAGAVASTAGVQDLAGGLKYVGATAKTLNIPLDDTVTSLAALNNAGIDATTAGTSLNRFFLGLTGNSDKARKKMAELGLSFEDANGNMLPMNKIIPQLNKQLEGMGDAQRVATLKTLFGVEGMRAANVLLKLNTDGYAKLKDEVNKNGVAQQLAEARMKGTAGALEQLKGSAETAAKAVGNALAPAVELIAGILTTALNLFTALPGPIQTVIVVIAAFAAALGPILFLMGAIATSTNLATGAILAKNAALKVVTAAQWLWNAALSANPIGLVVLAIAGLIAIILTLTDSWDDVIEVLDKVKDAIIGFVKNAIDWLKDNWKDILAVLTGPFGLFVKWLIDNKDDILQKAKDIYNSVKGWLEDNWPKILAVLTGPFGLLVAFLVKHKDEVITKLKDLWEDAKTAISEKLDAIKTVFTDKWEEIKTAVSKKVEETIGKVLYWWDALKDWIKDYFSDKAESFLGAIKSGWNLVKDTVGNIVEALKLSIGNKFLEMFTNVTEWVGKIKTGVVEKFTELKDGTINVITALKERIINIWNLIKQTLGELVDKTLEKFKPLYNEMLEVGKSIANGIIDGIFKVTGVFRTKLAQWIKDNIPDWIKTTLKISSPSKVMMGIGENISEGLYMGMGLPGKPGINLPSINVGGNGAGSNITINITAGAGTDPYSVGRAVQQALNRYTTISK
jgi:TP901 family phage tail tape measure protein